MVLPPRAIFRDQTILTARNSQDELCHRRVGGERMGTSNRGISAGKPRRLVELVLRAREGHPERLLVHLPTLTAPRNRSAPDDRRAPIVAFPDNGLRRLSPAMRQPFVSLKLSAKQRGASSLWPAMVREFSGRWSVR